MSSLIVGVRPALTPRVAWVHCGLGASMAAALVLLRSTELAAIPVAIVGLTTAVATVVGRVRNRPAVSRPWTLLAASCVLFVAAAVLRPTLAGTVLSPLTDAVTLAGYGALLGGLIGLLRTRHSTSRATHELIDGAVVLVSVGALAVDALTLPTVRDNGLTVDVVLLGVYPVIDTIIVFVVLLLSWTSANRVLSFGLLGLALVSLLVGDVGYALLGTQGLTVGSPLLDLPFVVAFTFLGAAALHPSMRKLSAIQQRPVPAWSRGRLGLLVPMMLIPAVVALGGHGSSPSSSVWVGTVSGALVTLLFVLRAVTAVRDHTRAEQGLRHQATHDPLTHLANRPQLIATVDGLLDVADREGGHVDLLFLDLDAFKLVNDTWGHVVGDRVLCLAATRLRELSKSPDVVARIGGDEFVVACYVSADRYGCGESAAAEIVTMFRRPWPDEASLVTTVSVGLSSSRRAQGSADRPTAESLLRDADTAMYRSKGAGRDQYTVFDASMHDSVRARVEIELALRTALERHELSLHYQPIVSLVSGDVVGAEALLRWTHPRLGQISPLDFIPVAEETGLIVEIGEWVVSEGLRQLARWRTMRAEAGLPDLWLAVNVSARQLRDATLVEHVRTELSRHHVPPELLVMELTETAIMADEVLAEALLHQLRTLGVVLAVDDFGTGYSSLGHLRRFPVSKVKIDREFVAGIESSPDDAEIVRAVVAMSLAMHLDVVAEGIETEGQRDLLAAQGIQQGQGWLFGRPVPADECSFVLPAPLHVAV